MDPRSLRVYVVTSSDTARGRTHLDVVVAAIDGGATAVQLRAPELDDDALRDAVREVSSRCREAGMLFVLNDRPDLAAELDVGVHVGRDDAPLEARSRLGDDRVLGISVDTPAEAVAARTAGADYLGVTVFATRTKTDARPLGLDGLRAIVDATDLPVVAIGGIGASNARDVIAAGATGVAVISAVGSASDPVAATRALVAAVGITEAA